MKSNFYLSWWAAQAANLQSPVGLPLFSALFFFRLYISAGTLSLWQRKHVVILMNDILSPSHSSQQCICTPLEVSDANWTQFCNMALCKRQFWLLVNDVAGRTETTLCASLTFWDFPLIGTKLSPITTELLNLKGPMQVEVNGMYEAPVRKYLSLSLFLSAPGLWVLSPPLEVDQWRQMSSNVLWQ